MTARRLLYRENTVGNDDAGCTAQKRRRPARRRVKRRAPRDRGALSPTLRILAAPNSNVNPFFEIESGILHRSLSDLVASEYAGRIAGGRAPQASILKELAK